MKYLKLDRQEQQMLKDFEIGKLQSVEGAKREIARYRTTARRILGKLRNV